jgi:hypothetical protein
MIELRRWTDRLDWGAGFWAFALRLHVAPWSARVDVGALGKLLSWLRAAILLGIVAGVVFLASGGQLLAAIALAPMAVIYALGLIARAQALYIKSSEERQR